MLENRKPYKGIRNGWINDKDEIVFADERTNVLMGSVRYPNVFLCSKCFRRYWTPWMAKKHAEKKCSPEFKDIIYQNDGLSIAHISSMSAQNERLIAERVSAISKLESHWDFPLLHSNNWITTEFRSDAFLMLKDDTIIGYVPVRYQELQYSGTKKHFHIVSDIFTIKHYRRKGLTIHMLEQSLKAIGEDYSTAVFMGPLTENGFKFLLKIQEQITPKALLTWCVQPHFF